MHRTIFTIIPRTTGTGVLTIDRPEWDPIIDLVQSEFDARLVVHRHEPGAFHGRSFVAVPHYLVELTAEDEQLPEIIKRIDPLIEAVVERNSTSISVPAAR